MPLGEINGILPNLPVNRGGTSWNQACLGLTGRVRDDRIRDHNSLRAFFSVFLTRKSIKIESNRSLPKKFNTKQLAGWHVIYTPISIFSLEISVHEPCFGLSCGSSKLRALSADYQMLQGIWHSTLLINQINQEFFLGSYNKTSLKSQVHQKFTVSQLQNLMCYSSSQEKFLKNGSRFHSLILVFWCSQHHSPSSSCVGSNDIWHPAESPWHVGHTFALSSNWITFLQVLFVYPLSPSLVLIMLKCRTLFVMALEVLKETGCIPSLWCLTGSTTQNFPVSMREILLQASLTNINKPTRKLMLHFMNIQVGYRGHCITYQNNTHQYTIFMGKSLKMTLDLPCLIPIRVISWPLGLKKSSSSQLLACTSPEPSAW